MPAARTPGSATPASTPTFPRAGATPSPLPTRPTIVVVTPVAGQLDRWKEYESALAQRLLSHLPVEDVLFEWEVLGQTIDTVYVWATCMATVLVGQVNPGYPHVSMPAAIHLREDGTVGQVDIPGAGTFYARSIREMFPGEVQERIFGDSIDYHRLEEHIRWRVEHPHEPPIIVLDATQMP